MSETGGRQGARGQGEEEPRRDRVSRGRRSGDRGRQACQRRGETKRREDREKRRQRETGLGGEGEVETRGDRRARDVVGTRGREDRERRSQGETCQQASETYG